MGLQHFTFHIPNLVARGIHSHTFAKLFQIFKSNYKMSFQNKVCIITGSGQGMGKAFATKLLENGAKVCISDVNEVKANATLDELRSRFGDDSVCFVKCDVTQKNEIVHLFDEAENFFKVKCIDVMVNNAGVNDNFGWQKAMEVNILGLMTASEIALERMTKSPNKGAIVNMASTAALVTGIGQLMIGYTVSKTGVLAYTRSMAEEYKNHGVAMKCICPLWVDTELVSSAKEHSGRLGSMVTQSVNETGGFMQPEDVAESFYKLLTECGNGTVMWTSKTTPCILMPDVGKINLAILAIMSKFLHKVNGSTIVGPRQQIMLLSLAVLVLTYVLSYFPSLVLAGIGLLIIAISLKL